MDNMDQSSEDSKEVEANRIARESFIPRAIWKRCEAYTNPTYQSIDKLSRELKIHPSIIAGRIRREMNNWGVFADLVGQNEVKKIFEAELNAEGI
jgi:HTH-type transcriptional regulator/antitoxin HigA